MSRRVLFHRTYQGWTGGHLVHAQYMRLMSRMPGFEVELYLTPDSHDIARSPWAEFADRVVVEWRPEASDIVFMAGLDWLACPRELAIESRKPVINLIQHLRHADRKSELSGFLDRRALRICVSDAVADAIRNSGRCNGSVATIRNAVSPEVAARPAVDKVVTVAIAASKQPDLAQEIGAALDRAGISVDVIPACDRGSFLQRLARAKIAVLLPHEREGFYLPALECMAIGSLVVCADCIGNRCYCEAGVNSLVPAEYSAAGILRSVEEAMSMSAQDCQSMLKAGRATVDRHSERHIAGQLASLLRDI